MTVHLPNFRFYHQKSAVTKEKSCSQIPSSFLSLAVQECWEGQETFIMWVMGVGKTWNMKQQNNGIHVRECMCKTPLASTTGPCFSKQRRNKPKLNKQTLTKGKNADYQQHQDSNSCRYNAKNCFNRECGGWRGCRGCCVCVSERVSSVVGGEDVGAVVCVWVREWGGGEVANCWSVSTYQ